MVTGVHIAGTDYEKSPLYKIVKHTIETNPSHTFIIFIEKETVNSSSNCIQIKVSPLPKNKLVLYYWYNYKLPKLLVKYGFTVFINDAGFLAPVSNIKQYLFFKNLHFEKDKNVFFKKKMLDAVKRADAVLVTDEYIGSVIKEKYHIKSEKIDTLFCDLPLEKLNLQWNVIEDNKGVYADGFDYFLFPVSNASSKKIIAVLKAFSQFKKWQKSSMKLVLLLNNVAEENLINDFKNYKYKDEVKIIKQNDQNILPLISSAFTMVFFGNYEDVSFVFTALQNNIAVIAEDNIVNNILFESAVLFSPTTDRELAQKMQLMYKDELQKNAIIRQSESLLNRYDTVKASQNLFHLITG